MLLVHDPGPHSAHALPGRDLRGLVHDVVHVRTGAHVRGNRVSRSLQRKIRSVVDQEQVESAGRSGHHLLLRRHDSEVGSAIIILLMKFVFHF